MIRIKGKGLVEKEGPRVRNVKRFRVRLERVKEGRGREREGKIE